jgi:hypothetical protein
MPARHPPVHYGMQPSQALPVDLGGWWAVGQARWNHGLNQRREAACSADTSRALRVVEQEAREAAQKSCSEVAPFVLDLQGQLELMVKIVPWQLVEIVPWQSLFPLA